MGRGVLYESVLIVGAESSVREPDSHLTNYFGKYVATGSKCLALGKYAASTLGESIRGDGNAYLYFSRVQAAIYVTRAQGIDTLREE